MRHAGANPESVEEPAMDRICLVLLGLLLLAACKSPEDWAKSNPGSNAIPQATYGGSGAGY
jgi:hypothetical protein